MGYAPLHRFIENINKKIVILIILIIGVLVFFSLVIFSLVKKQTSPSVDYKRPQPELLSPSPTFALPPRSEKEDFIEEEFKTKPQKAYEYTLSNGRKITIYIPEDANPPPLSVVEEMVKSEK